MLLLFVPATVAGRSTSAGENAREGADEIVVREDVEFGRVAGKPLLLDLALPHPTGRLRPAIVYLHGGSWRHGKKSLGAPRRAAQRGFVAISIDYRLAPRHKWPAQIEDAKCAVRWLRAQADELKVDPARIGAQGSSAGAQLAMLLGTLDEGVCEGTGGWADHSSRVQAVVSFAGPSNMLDEYRYSTNAKLLAPFVSRLPNNSALKNLAGSGELVTDYMGGKPSGDLIAQYRLASPVLQVSEGDAPMLLIQGTNDPIVPPFHAEQMDRALTKAGVSSRLELQIGVGHAAGSDLNHRLALDYFVDQFMLPTAKSTRPD